jgi:hemolysin-activating ACP:hemolysin acyltransferase
LTSEEKGMVDDMARASGRPLGVKGSAALDPNDFGMFLGLATWLMSMSKEHKDLPIGTIDRRVLPAIILKQFKLIMKDKMPVAFIAWATVSDEVEAQLEVGSDGLDLKLWRSGKNIVIIECVSPFAPTETVKSKFLEEMKSA